MTTPTTPITPEVAAVALELAFVVYATEEFHHEEGFPPMPKVEKLIHAIIAAAEGVETSAEDMLNHLFEKYNIGDEV